MKINRYILVIFALVICWGCSKTKEVVVEPTPTVKQPAFKTIFYDNFDTRKNEWQQSRGTWQVSPDGFFLQQSADPRDINSIIYAAHPQAADGTIETFVRIKPDLPTAMTNSLEDKEIVNTVRYIIGAGIIFRMKDDENYYMFRLAGEEGAVLGKMVGNDWEDLSNPRSLDYLTERVRFSESNWYRLKVEVYRNRITCYINDSVVASVSDSTFNLGKFGLCTFKTRADFDYIKVYDKTIIEN
jgi:hypothetical protein